MDVKNLNAHLSQIETHGSAVLRSHRGGADEANLALAGLVHRYRGAIHRYLLGSLRDADAADELAQEFAPRFLRGDFKNAEPTEGRFRDFLKRADYHLMPERLSERRACPVNAGWVRLDLHRARDIFRDAGRRGEALLGYARGGEPGRGAERAGAAAVLPIRVEAAPTTAACLSSAGRFLVRPEFEARLASTRTGGLPSWPRPRRIAICSSASSPCRWTSSPATR